MKSLPLAEPTFLHGRTNVVQRAIRMSFVLGLLTALAILLIAMPILLGFAALLGPQSTNPILLLAAGSAAVLAVHVPLHLWNQRSEVWGLYSLAALSAASCGVGYWLWGFSRLAESEVVFAFVLMISASGLPLLRSGRRHLMAYLVSIACVVLPGIFLAAGQRAPSGFLKPAYAYIPEPFYGLLLFMGIFVAMAIPWGIPFWWPPDDALPTDPAPQLEPDA